MSRCINPKMIVLARESRGVSQSELSKQISISQGKLSKIENGLLSADDSELKSLSKELHYPESFFLRSGEIYGAGLSEMFHRKRQSVPQKSLMKLYALIEVRRMQLSQLMKAVDFGETSFFPVDPNKYDGDVRSIAQIVRSTWRIPRGPIQNLVETIERAGAVIIPFDFEGTRIDAISIKPADLPPLIFINWEKPMDRIRFTLAHEVGHLIMHDVPPSDPDDIEKQADEFASEFLMPSQEIANQLTGLTINALPNLKLYWKASMSSLVMKSRDLGKITERQARYMWMQLGHAGYKTREPEHLEPPREEPQLLRDMIQLHVSDLSYSPSDLAAILDLFEDQLVSDYLRPTRHLHIVN